MISSRYLIKTLNPTEAGETNTNDSYFLIPQNIEAAHLFNTSEEKFSFEAFNSLDGSTCNLRYAKERKRRGEGFEQRVYKLGPLCRTYNIKSGDEICFENRIINGQSHFYVNAIRKQKCVLLQKIKDTFIIARNDTAINFSDFEDTFVLEGIKTRIKTSFIGQGRKRKDSPNLIDLFQVSIDGNPLNDVLKGEFIVLDFETKEIKLVKDPIYQEINQ